MLEATNLTKQYNGHTALDRLNLRIEPGEVFCLLGANGAGKTTTINLFLNFIEPTSGTATINGVDVTSGLDPKASNEFSELLKRLSGEGVAILMATHDLFRAKESGTRVGIMRQGTLRQVLSTDEVGHADLERIYLEHMH
jgi:ABC-type multidrug transport system ATPase subunit